MMKTKLFLCVLLFLVSITTHANDVEIDGIYYNLNQKNKVAEVTNGGTMGRYSGNVVIPKSVNYMGVKYSVVSISDFAFYYCSNLTTVKIPNSVTTIGSAFFLCTSLSSVTIPNSVTTIGSGAFEYCYSLSSVIIPNSVSVINEGTFYYCTSLASVTIPNSVITIGNNAFYECTSLSSVTIPNSVTSIGELAFSGCTSLSSVTIPNSVTSIGKYAFRNCTSLSSVTIPNGVSILDECTFENCTALASVSIPNSIISIGYSAFRNCSSLTSVDIPNSVKYIKGYAFEGCNELKEISLGSGVIEIGTRGGDIWYLGNTFASCGNLEVVRCHTKNVPTAHINTFGQSLVEHATLLVPEGSVANYNSTSPWSDFGTIKRLTMDEIIHYVYDNDAITATVVSGIAAYEGEVSIPVDVKYMGTTYNVTAIAQGAFKDHEMTAITIPLTVQEIGYDAFRGCKNLVTMTAEGVYDSRNGCNAIIRTASNTLIAGCQTTVIPDNVVKIFDHAFYGQTHLKEINIPTSVKDIGSGAFYGCTDLKTATMNEGLETIENYVFYNCGKLTAINIPSTVTSIGDYAFSGCDSLTTVIVNWNEPITIGSSQFSNRANATLYVPEGSKVLYETADYWNEFKEIVEMANIAKNIYYLQNVETGLFLNQGNAWNTHAVLSEDGLPVDISQLADGSYKIFFIEGSAFDNLLFRASSADVYVDYNHNNEYAPNWCQYWTITHADNGLYHIQSLITDDRYGQSVYPSTYLGNNPNKEAFDQNGNALGIYNEVDGNVLNEAGMNINWRLLTTEEMEWPNLHKYELPMVIANANKLGIDTSDATALYKNQNADLGKVVETITALRTAIADQLLLSIASPNNPVEVTGLIQNSTFAWNHDYGWSAYKSNSRGTHTLRVGESEYWNTSFSYGQYIKGLPNGHYQVKVKAFHRPGNDSDVLINYQNGVDLSSAVLYANDESVILANQASAAQSSQVDGKGFKVNGWYVPSSMEDAKAWFDAGYYENTLTVEVTNGMLIFGIKLDEEISGQWVIFDDFQLYYLGKHYVTVTDISELDNAIYIEPLEARKGETVALNIQMKNTLSPVGCSFKLTLPEGFSLLNDEDGDVVYGLGSRAKKMSVVYQASDERTFDFALTPSSGTASITGTEGTLITLQLEVPEKISERDYEILLTKNLIQSKDNSNTTVDNALTDIVSAITIFDYLLGDVNDDGNVTPADAIMILYHYFGVEQAGFIAMAADVNGDGNISPADAIEVLYMYFNAGQANAPYNNPSLDPQ